ncbi:hypothetical protein KOR42_54960 [Thalassoglobus neptunius]|uniref:DUF1552 domain-containing protein n=1 Tax=Thalassoglobus neptunius TaxID=1938619 RepID=A0A5C5UW09_9PLAN|nr:DUF1552 domain-containing protein [Thalassoglobus neptunius]TWT29803.1 hypothetical protein KOR42_54960 [Thalassoglobus neptunius]
MNRSINRRTFLRTSGICLGLPFLESMTPSAAAASTVKPPMRLLIIGTPFGFDPPEFVPTTTGRDYELTPYLKNLADHRDDLTLITGTSHPDSGAAHQSEVVLLSGAPYPDSSFNLKNTISIDQEFASHFRGQTRYSSLVLSTGGHFPVPSISITANGVPIPPEESPSKIFASLFLGGNAEEKMRELDRIREGRSLLDFVGERAKRLSRQVSSDDRDRLEEYFTSVRDVEKQLQMSREWVHRPKPTVPGKPPKDIEGPGQQGSKLKLMLDMTRLALVTDSTRSICLRTFGDHHSLTHHGRETEKVTQLQKVETELIQSFSSLLDQLKTSRESTGERLLDNTMVLLTSNMRDGNSHKCWDAPAILAGGGFKHGSHISFHPEWM